MRNANKTDREIPLGDPIIRELRAVRDDYFASCGYDVDELFRRIRARQRASGREYVRIPPRRLSSTAQAAERRLKAAISE